MTITSYWMKFNIQIKVNYTSYLINTIHDVLPDCFKFVSSEFSIAWEILGSGLFLTSVAPNEKSRIFSFKVAIEKSPSRTSWNKICFVTFGMTPSKTSCIISDASPSTTWKYFEVFSTESLFTPYADARLGSMPTCLTWWLCPSFVRRVYSSSENWKVQ